MKKLSLKAWLLISGIVILLATNGITIYYLNQKPSLLEKPVTTNDQSQTENQTLPTQNINTTEPQEQPKEVQIPEKNLEKGQIKITWNGWLTKKYDGFSYTYLISKLTQSEYEEFQRRFTFYKAGTISEGTYSGKDFYLIDVTSEGMGSTQGIYRAVKTDNGKDPNSKEYESEFIILTKQSTEIYKGSVEEKIFTKNEDLMIGNLETPDTIEIPDTNLSFIKEKKEPYQFLSVYDNPIPLFKYNETDYVYKAKLNGSECFIVKAIDGSVRRYFFDMPFITVSKNIPEQYSYDQNFSPKIISSTWLDGSKNNNEYISSGFGSCGFRECYQYADYITDVNNLEKTGTTDTGDPLYELKEKNLKLNSDSEKSILQTLYDGFYPGEKEKLSYDNFLNDHPIIYWVDPFGGIMEYTNAKYLPAVECGKPVIYLYPEQTTDVSVQVAPNGGFSITEPLYNNGWFVKASPNGEIYNYDDKKSYPYLFWEGHGINYKLPEQGFVVEKAEVEQFLKEKLALLGLNENESKEFIDFWLPKMQKDNYYFITFLPQNEFNIIAPLNISPKPDTIIRVFMDYKGLNEYTKVVEPQIVTPERKGFTVVEWGGALHK
jgi:hypothetical protein